MSESLHLKSKIEELETALKALKQQYEQTEELSKIGSYKINLDNGIVEWTKGLYDIFNFSYDTELPTPDEYYAYVHPEDVQTVRERFTNCVLNNTFFDLKYRILLKNGTVKNVHSKGEVTVNNNGERILFGFFRDITTEIELSKQIEESEKKYRNLVENNPLGIVVFTLKNIVFINVKMSKLLNLQANNDVTKFSIFDFIHAKEKNRFKEILLSVQNDKNRRYRSTHLQFVINDECKDSEILIIPYVVNKKPSWKCIVTDKSEITKVKHKAKRVFTDAIYMSRKLQQFSEIDDKLEQIIASNKLDEGLFTQLRDQLHDERNLEQMWLVFQENFEALYEDFFSRLLQQAPTLTQQELKHCAFIKLNFETKEIAQMFNVKPTTIQISRVRIKKKFGLAPEQDLINFIIML